MEFESTDDIAMVYETLKNIDTAITRLQKTTSNNQTLIWQGFLKFPAIFLLGFKSNRYLCIKFI
jgi:hypothetical protein